MTDRSIRNITQLKLDEKAVVAKVKLPEGEADRLDALGLHIGSTVRVLSGSVKNGILIAVGDGQLRRGAENLRLLKGADRNGPPVKPKNRESNHVVKGTCGRRQGNHRRLRQERPRIPTPSAHARRHAGHEL